MERRYRVAIALLGTAAVLTGPSMVATVTANDVAGTVVRCGAVTEFVAPSEAGEGSFTLLGIGPGFPNPFDDPDHHTFPIAPESNLDPALVSILEDLAAGDHFACIRFHAADVAIGGPALVDALEIPATTRLCPLVSERTDGVFHFIVVTEWHGDLIADAGVLVRGDPDLHNFLELLGRYPDTEVGCLTFTMAPTGRLASLAVDVEFRHCGPVTNRDDLAVGGVQIADATSSSAELLPPKVAAAATLAAAAAGDACVDGHVVANRWRSAALTLALNRCGDVTRSGAGVVQVDELPIDPVLLSEAQATKLESVVGGSGCLAVSVTANAVAVTLRELSAPLPTPGQLPTAQATSAAEPTLEPTQSPIPSPTAPPTAASSTPSTVAPTGAASESDGSAWLVVALVTLGAASVTAFLAFRPRRIATEAIGGRVLGAEHPPQASGVPDADLVQGDRAPRGVAAPIALTPREHEVLGMLFEGLSNKEIAGRLFISESTAGVHVSNLMAKLGARSRAEATAIAYRLGLESPGQRLHH